MNWSTEVSEILKKWLNEKESRNASQLAHKSCTSYSTVRRMIEGERETSLESAIPVLGKVLKPIDLVALVRKHFSNLDSLWKAFAENGVVFLEGSENIDWHEVDNDILSLATASSGTSLQVIEREFGAFGMKRVNYLLAVGVIREINSRIKLFSENWTDPSHSSMLKRMALRMEHYKRENIGEFAAFRTLTVEASDEDISRFLVEIKELFASGYKRMSNSVGEPKRVFTLDIAANFVKEGN